MDYYESRDNLDYDRWALGSEAPSSTDLTTIQSFYHKSHIFITGGSGFIGKVLIEKLLRTCDVEKIYILLRSKKGKSPSERLQEQFNDELFFRLKHLRPNFLDKIQMIPGDIEQPNIGLSEEDYQFLVDHVNIVIHGAATLSMDILIGKAFDMNIRATQCVLDMFEKMPNKKSFSYISTAYAHAHRTRINERFYPTTMDPSEVKCIVDSMDAYDLACLSPVLTGAYSNSYSFSKALAEEVCRTYVNKGLPVVVVRPSIVVSTYREPLKNWINNVYGATGVLFGASMGFLHVFFADPDAKADLIPVDLVGNAILASLWEVSQRSPSPTPVAHDQDTPHVYNLVSSPQKPVTWNDYKVFNERAPEVFPVVSSKSIYYYSFGLTKNPFWFHTRVILTHVLPAIFVDLVLRLKKKKPMMLKAHRKVTNFLKHFHMYAEKDWVYANGNVQRMWSRLSPEDQRLFLFNIEFLDWTWYYDHFMRGIQSYILKETFAKEGAIEKAKIHTARTILVHRIVKYGGTSLLTFLLGYLVWWIFLS